MSAWQRSNILLREEKGIGPFSFKRLLLAGAAAGLVSVGLGGALGFTPGCAGAGLTAGLLLALTQPFDGLPLARYGLDHLRGVAAAAEPPGPLADLLRVAPEDGEVTGAADLPVLAGERDPIEWELLGGFAEATGSGMAPSASPFGEGD